MTSSVFDYIPSRVLVGCMISVAYTNKDGVSKFYDGKITKLRNKEGENEHFIQYNDGDHRW